MTRLLACASTLALAAPAAAQEMAFQRIASFPTTENFDGTPPEETSPEIVAATEDGQTLVYTDSPAGVVGFVDLADPAAPAPLGTAALGGEPTSVAVAAGMALVGVNTSESFTEPSGHLAALNVADRAEVDRCDLPGQPDAVAVAPDGSFAAVAIENERDEDAGDGRVPQMPPGTLYMVDLTEEGLPDCDTARTPDLTGLAEVAPGDPEPEYVAINEAGEVVVTMQENNHLAIVSSAGEVLSHFSAGTSTLEGVDATEDGRVSFTETLEDLPREPDAVAWIGTEHVVTADEGDMDGGTRGFTIFSREGEVVHDPGLSLEHAVAAIGHYPEERSGNKGVEPESVTVATYDGTPHLFVGTERASVVAVYDVTDPAAPELLQLLPSGIGPEGYAAIPDRGLLVSANEVDLREDGGPAAHLMVYERREGASSYPAIRSEATQDGAPVAFGALSGLAPGDTEGRLYAVNDSFYALQPTIFEIDATQEPAVITNAIRVTRGGMPAQKLDMEGIAPDGEGGFWIANEGRTDRLIPHAVIRVSATGEIEEEVALPAELLAVERRHGLEGITRAEDGTLYMVLQREWEDDAPDTAKILRWTPGEEQWSAAAYPKTPAETGWVGLSEVAFHDGALLVLERDNQFGGDARVKRVTRVSLDGLEFAPLGEEPPVAEVEEVRDLIPDLEATGGYVVDKVEGLAVDAGGNAFVVGDNDGTDDSSGETVLLRLGGL